MSGEESFLIHHFFCFHDFFDIETVFAWTCMACEVGVEREQHSIVGVSWR